MNISKIKITITERDGTWGGILECEHVLEFYDLQIERCLTSVDLFSCELTQAATQAHWLVLTAKGFKFNVSNSTSLPTII